MKISYDEFEKIWGESDEEIKKKYAYIGFVRCALLFGRLVDSGVLSSLVKKEEP